MTQATGWRGSLSLAYRREQGRTVALDRHEGPLRVLKALYPEGPAVCHHVLLHPPGGVVGGDGLEINIALAADTHALLTTPGATRFYRSDGAWAVQQVRLQLQAGARCEWLPLETIAHSGCLARSQVQAELAPGAEMMGWDVLALGLPASKQGFDSGCFEQRIQVPGVWLDHGRIAAADTLLRGSPLGLAGHNVLATLWFAAGTALPVARRDGLLEAARQLLPAAGLHAGSRTAPHTDPHTEPEPNLHAGVTAAQPSVLVLRVLARRVEPALQLLAAVRAAWRGRAWGMAAAPPRIWQT